MAPVCGCQYYDIVVYDCKIIAFVNLQWLKRYLLLLAIYNQMSFLTTGNRPTLSQCGTEYVVFFGLHSCYVKHEWWWWLLVVAGVTGLVGVVDACRLAIGGSQVQTRPRLLCYSLQQGGLNRFICWIAAFTAAARFLVNGFKWHCHICQSALEMSWYSAVWYSTV